MVTKRSVNKVAIYYKHTETQVLHNLSGPSMICFDGLLYFNENGHVRGYISNNGVYVCYINEQTIRFSMDARGKYGYRANSK